jgi:hypothetical protein
MYADGVPVQEIRAERGFSLERLYDWLNGAPQPDGRTLLPPIPRRRIVLRKEDPAETRTALIARIMRASDLQIRGVEQRLGGENTEPDDRERDAHMLAVITKTLRELMVHDTPNPPNKKPAKPARTQDDFIPRDVDELRRELARRVDLLRQRRAAGGTASDA